MGIVGGGCRIDLMWAMLGMSGVGGRHTTRSAAHSMMLHMLWAKLDTWKNGAPTATRRQLNGSANSRPNSKVSGIIMASADAPVVDRRSLLAG